MAINNYVTLAEMKAYMPNNELATSPTNLWDTAATVLCEAVSRQIDTFTFRDPGAYAANVSTVLYYDGILPTATDFVNNVFVDEMVGAPTLVEISPTGDQNSFGTVVASDYYLWPYNATFKQVPYSRIDLNPSGITKRWPSKPKSIRVTATFGYSSTAPSTLHEAAKLMVVRLLRKAQQDYVDTGIQMDYAQLSAAAKLEDDIKDMILHFRKTAR